jgi:glycine cleavage system H lipoate-binding protein
MDESDFQEPKNRRGWSGEIKEKFHTVKRPCIHNLSGSRDAPSECSFHYNCYRCAFHLSLTVADDPKAIREPAYSFAAGYRLAEGFYYHFGHGWVVVEQGGRVRTGIDDFASKVFGAAASLKLPPVGIRLKQGEAGWVFVRNGHEAAVRSPISGRVVAVNHDVLKDPGLCHDDPYNRGWLFCVEPSLLKLELDGLYYGREAMDWIEMENREVMRLLGPEYEQLSATGAEPVDDLFGHMPGLDWDRLVTSILRTEERD